MNVYQLEWRVLGPNVYELSEGYTYFLSFRNTAVHVFLVTLKLTQGIPHRQLRNKAITAVPVFSTIITSKHLV